MSNTRQKLDEAKYFLSQMEANVINISNFKFNLSAFVSASRSVTLFMQKEYATEKKFSGWYKNWQLKMAINPIYQLINRKRAMTIHTQPIETRKDTKITLTETLSLRDRVVLATIHQDGSVELQDSGFEKDKPPSYKKPKVEHLWFFNDYLDKDILSVATDYTSSLETLVKECESKFKEKIKE